MMATVVATMNSRTRMESRFTAASGQEEEGAGAAVATLPGFPSVSLE